MLLIFAVVLLFVSLVQAYILRVLCKHQTLDFADWIIISWLGTLTAAMFIGSVAEIATYI